MRRQPPVRAVVRPAGHRQDPLPQAHRAHAVVGPQHDDLGHPRARGRRGRQQGLPDHQRAGGVPPAPAGPLGIQPVLGRRSHGLRVQPRARLPAAAHRGASVAADRLEPVRGLSRGHGAHRRHRRRDRGPLGHPSGAPLGHDRGARVRRHVDAPRARRRRLARAGARRALLAGARRRARAPDDPALVHPREQVAGGSLRARRPPDRRPRRHAAPRHRPPARDHGTAHARRRRSCTARASSPGSARSSSRARATRASCASPRRPTAISGRSSSTSSASSGPGRRCATTWRPCTAESGAERSALAEELLDLGEVRLGRLRGAAAQPEARPGRGRRGDAGVLRRALGGVARA